MIIFLLIVIIGLLIYIICENKKESKLDKTLISWRKLLPGYIGKNCEIVVKEPLVNIDVMYSVTGILTDVDDEWLVVFQFTDMPVPLEIQADKYAGKRDHKEQKCRAGTLACSEDKGKNAVRCLYLHKWFKHTVHQKSAKQIS